MPDQNLTMVEDRDKYYQEKQVHAQQALLAALQSLGGTTNVSQDQINNLAAMLVMEGVGAEAILRRPLSNNSSSRGLAATPIRCRGWGVATATFPCPTPCLPGHRSLDLGLDPAATLAALHRSSAFAPASPVPHMPGYSMAGGLSAADPSTMSRESSMCSLASADWWSSASANSRRNSVDMPGPVPQPGRLSLDAALHMHHQMVRANQGGMAPPQYGGGYRMQHSSSRCTTRMRRRRYKTPFTSPQRPRPRPPASAPLRQCKARSSLVAAPLPPLPISCRPSERACRLDSARRHWLPLMPRSAQGQQHGMQAFNAAAYPGHERLEHQPWGRPEPSQWWRPAWQPRGARPCRSSADQPTPRRRTTVPLWWA